MATSVIDAVHALFDGGDHGARNHGVRNHAFHRGAHHGAASLSGLAEAQPATREEKTAIVDAFIDREMQARARRRVGWKQMEACFKWRKVLDYLEAYGQRTDATEKAVRAAMMGDKLAELEYDTDTGRITKLGWNGL